MIKVKAVNFLEKVSEYYAHKIKEKTGERPRVSGMCFKAHS